MLEPVNTVLKAVRRLSLLRGDVVLVAGQGPIGLMFTRLLQLAGAQVIATDLLEPRLKLAKKFGAKWMFNVGQASRLSLNQECKKSKDGDRRDACPTSTGELIRRATRGRGLDAAVIAVPSADVVQQALQWTRGAGQVLLFSHTKSGARLTVDPATICVDEKDLLGSYSSDFTLQDEVARLVFSRQLDVRNLISHFFPLEQTAAAIALAARPTPDSLKVLVRAEVD